MPPSSLRCLGVTGLATPAAGRAVERLLARESPPRVVGLDLRVPRRLEGRIAFHRIDLTSPTADTTLAEYLQKERCDALLHCGFFTDACADVEYSHELEVIGSLHVMNAAAAAAVRKLVVLSTARVYGPWPDNPNFLTEEHPLRGHPPSHVVRDRVEMERLLRLFADRHPDMRVVSLRPALVSGPNAADPYLRHLSRQRVTTLVGYDPLMQMLHEDDLQRAIELALERDVAGAFNLAGDGVLPLSTLLRLADKRARVRPHPLLYGLGWIESVRRTGDPPAGFYDYLRFLWTVDTARAKALLGFQPEYTTKEAWMSHVVSRRLRKYR